MTEVWVPDHDPYTSSTNSVARVTECAHVAHLLVDGYRVCRPAVVRKLHDLLRGVARVRGAVVAAVTVIWRGSARRSGVLPLASAQLHARHHPMDRHAQLGCLDTVV